jgi:hypothetical protein
MIDNRGKLRYRFRRDKWTTIYLPGQPGDKTFEEALQLCLSGGKPEPRNKKNKDQKKDEATIKCQRKSLLSRFITQAVLRVRERAHRRGIEMDLTDRAMKKMMEGQNWCCAVSGIPFPLGERGQNERPFFPSIDRIDPKKGYTINNVRLVCMIVNLAMHNWGEGPLIKLARALRANRVVYIASDDACENARSYSDELGAIPSNS